MTECVDCKVCEPITGVSEGHLVQNLLIYQLEGIGCYALPFIERGEGVDQTITELFEECLVALLNPEGIERDKLLVLLRRTQEVKEALQAKAIQGEQYTACCTYQLAGTYEELVEDAKRINERYKRYQETNRYLIRETMIGALKGLSVYTQKNRALGVSNKQVDQFYLRAFACLSDENTTVNALHGMLMRMAEKSARVVDLKDDDDEPFLIMTERDLQRLEQLLEHVKNKGVVMYKEGKTVQIDRYQVEKYPELVTELKSQQDWCKEYNLKAVKITDNH